LNLDGNDKNSSFSFGNLSAVYGVRIPTKPN